MCFRKTSRRSRIRRQRISKLKKNCRKNNTLLSAVREIFGTRVLSRVHTKWSPFCKRLHGGDKWVVRHITRLFRANRMTGTLRKTVCHSSAPGYRAPGRRAVEPNDLVLRPGIGVDRRTSLFSVGEDRTQRKGSGVREYLWQGCRLNRCDFWYEPKTQIPLVFGFMPDTNFFKGPFLRDGPFFFINKPVKVGGVSRITASTSFFGF